MKPPTDGMALDSELILMGMDSCSPKCDSIPRPSAPSTPNECDSSTMSQAWCLRHTSTTAGKSIRSPSMEKTASTTTSLPARSGAADSARGPPRGGCDRGVPQQAQVGVRGSQQHAAAADRYRRAVDCFDGFEVE